MMLGPLLEALSGVRGCMKRREGPTIDTPQVRLQSELTVFVLAAVSALTAAKQYLGDPIHCIFDGRSGVKTEAIEAYCWIHATGPLAPDLVARLASLNPAPPHLARLCASHHPQPPDTAYYQWVHVFIILQAGMFLIPSRIWKFLEGGRMRSLSLNRVLDNFHDIDKWTASAESFVYTFHQNNYYLFKFVLCEFINLIIVMVVAQLTNLFLDGGFYSLGPFTALYVFSTPAERRDLVSPSCQIFPTVTSCQFPTGSLTGTVNVDHALCVLSLNIINDKIFLLEWFWFLLIFLIAVINLMMRVLSLLSPNIRTLYLKSTDLSFAKEDNRVIRRIVKKCKLGDWFLISQVRRNLPDRQFTAWLREVEMLLAVKIGGEAKGESRGTGGKTGTSLARRRRENGEGDKGRRMADEVGESGKIAWQNGRGSHNIE